MTREEFIDIACDLLRKKRKEKGLTQKDLAKRINVTQGQISQWENSRTLQMSTIEKIALALDCSFVNFISEYIDSNGKWIPVSERLPKAEYGEGDSVLCCTETGLMHILYWDGGNWCVPTGEPHQWVNHKTGWHDKVIAWMPLPEPYREEGKK